MKVENYRRQNYRRQWTTMHNTERRDPFYDRELDVKLKVVDRNLRPADRTVKRQRIHTVKETGINNL